ncbi:MAG: DUF4760 domain-containing protein, partial [Candidatus Hodarchaeales archaeon]
EDYNEKFGPSKNPDFAAKRFTTWNRLDGIGNLIIKGLVEAETAYQLYGQRSAWWWDKWEPIIMELRRRYNPGFMTGFEHLANEMKKMGLTSSSEEVFPIK